MNNNAPQEIVPGKEPGDSLTSYVAVRPPRSPATIPAQAANSVGITPRQILDSVRYWWKLALPAGIVLAAVAAAVVYLTFQPMYQASYVILIQERAPFIAFEVRQNEQSRAFVQTQVEMFRLSKLLGPVVSQPEIAKICRTAGADDPVAWLAKEIKVKQIGGSELFSVTFASPDPEDAAKVVDAVVSEYFNYLKSVEDLNTSGVINQLNKELDRMSADVRLRREKVHDIAKQVTGKDPAAGNKDAASSQARPLTNLENQMVAAEVDVKVLEARIAAFQKPAAENRIEVPRGAIEKAIAENANVQKIAADIDQRRVRLAHLATIMTNGKDSPRCQELSRAIDQEEKALKALKDSLRSQTQESLMEALIGKQRQELAGLRSDLEGRKIMLGVLKERYETELKSAKGYTGDALDLISTQQELVRAEKVRSLISERVLRLQTEKQAPARVTGIGEKADVPATPIQNIPYLRLILAMLGGLSVPFGLSILKEQMNRRVTDSDHLEQQTHLAVIGEIARLPSRIPSPQRQLGRRARRAVRLFEESVDALRTNLFLSSPSPPFHLLTVTSAVKQEGKTSVAVQLAVSIARASREPTLIIDADMRSPSVHKVFEVPLEPGFAKVLSGECPVKDAIVPTGSENVYVLPAGTLRASPHTLLANGMLGSVLASISDDYRYIIIDTPPVLAASESLVLAKAADAFLLCAMRDVSRVSQVKKVSERLIAAGGRLAGTVLSGIPISQYVHRYGSYPYPED